jgi:hypothetical protein
LALLKLGRPQDAGLDFQHGAKLESSTDPARAFNVARSLERVQGSDRSTLEQYRLEARMSVLQKAEEERRVRYQEQVKEQRDFLQKSSAGASSATVDVPAPAEVVKPVEVPGDATKPAGVVAPNAPPANPFSTGEEGKPADMKKDGVGAGAIPAGPAKADAAPAGAAKPDAGNPLAEPAEKPDVPAAGAGASPAGPAKADKSPAGAAKPDANPFGDAGDAAKPAPAAAGAKSDGAAKPDSVAKPDNAANPFAEEPAAPAGAAPADAKKPADEKKPADAKKPADEKKSDDNPFG